MAKKYGVLTSSQNPEEIANKVKGAVLLSSSIVIFLVSKLSGIELTVNDMTDVATSLGAVAGAIWAIYGTILHLIAWFYEIKQRVV